MSEGAGPAAEVSGGRGWIRNPRDFWGGLALLGLALFALWAGSDLPGQRGFAFGPGTAPRLFAVLLAILSVGIMVIGVVTDGPRLERYAIRGPLFVTAAVLAFAGMIRPVGLIISTFATFVIAGMASSETKWLENIIAAVAITAFSAFLFVKVLKLPFQFWPPGLGF